MTGRAIVRTDVRRVRHVVMGRRIDDAGELHVVAVPDNYGGRTASNALVDLGPDAIREADPALEAPGELKP